MKEKWTNVFVKGKRMYTKSSFCQSFFEERYIKAEQGSYREWDPRRSKLGAALKRGLKNHYLSKGKKVLYLGCAHGYTCSYVADMVGSRGVVFGVDPAPRVMRDFYFLSLQIPWLAPILADANKPESFAQRVVEVDVVFQDIAQRNQAAIFLKNCKKFLKKGGVGLLAVKARSIDAVGKPKQIYQKVRAELEKEMQVLEMIALDPLQKDHAFFVVKKR